jgi:hypothetical protein
MSLNNLRKFQSMMDEGQEIEEVFRNYKYIRLSIPVRVISCPVRVE